MGREAGRAARDDPYGVGEIGEDDEAVLREFELQVGRRGKFRLLFPAAATVGEYVPFFRSSLRSNHLLWSLVASGVRFPETGRPHHGSAGILE